MRTGILKVALVDLVLLVFAYYVLQDLGWRNSYGSSRGFLVSTSYSLLIRRLQLTNGASTLVSPPTLDWVQVVIALLIIINVAYALGAYRGTKPDKVRRG